MRQSHSCLFLIVTLVGGRTPGGETKSLLSFPACHPCRWEDATVGRGHKNPFLCVSYVSGKIPREDEVTPILSCVSHSWGWEYPTEERCHACLILTQSPPRVRHHGGTRSRMSFSVSLTLGRGQTPRGNEITSVLFCLLPLGRWGDTTGGRSHAFPFLTLSPLWVGGCHEGTKARLSFLVCHPR